jgi:hypothetical protein
MKVKAEKLKIESKIQNLFFIYLLFLSLDF